MISAIDAIARLQAGNLSFVSNEPPARVGLAREARRSELTSGQEPFAIILGCSDSRVPAEIILGQGLGDLFVVRVAGNIVARSHVGSVEFAAEEFGTRLVVVLGHTGCGAVQATVRELERPSANRSPNLHSIVDRIRPAVEPLLSEEKRLSGEALVAAAVRANIRASVDQLRYGSEILERLIRTEGLLVVGAEYSLETGLVEFLEEPVEG